MILELYLPLRRAGEHCLKRANITSRNRGPWYKVSNAMVTAAVARGVSRPLVRPSEAPLVVFVSSTIGEFASERQRLARAIESFRLTRPWLFEEAPASAETLANSYLRKIRDCDLFVLLIGSNLTPPVRKEWETATRAGKRRLAFIKSDASSEVKTWLRRADVKYDYFADEADLVERASCAIADELIKGYREFQLEQSDLNRLFQEVDSFRVSFTVRSLDAGEFKEISEYFPQLKELYPQVDTWVKRKVSELRQGTTQALIATYGLDRAGFALTSDKEPGVRKISTLVLQESYRGARVGTRLLYDVISKAVRDNIEKLYITVADERLQDLEGILSRYGFQVEGVSARRYRRGSSEWVWGKRLVKGVVRPMQLTSFVRQHLFNERGFHTWDRGPNCFVAEWPVDGIGRLSRLSRDRFLVYVQASTQRPDAYLVARGLAKEESLPLIYVGQEVQPESGDICLSLLDLEALFYPVNIQREIKGVIVPIRESFASALVPHSSITQMLPPSSVQLRSDNVYYKYPNSYQGLVPGSPIFFYETRRRTGKSRMIGAAKLVSLEVDDPATLFGRLGGLGVYTARQVADTAPVRGRNAGKVLALRFDWYREAQRQLGAEQVRRAVRDFIPRTARLIEYDECLKLMEMSGWNQPELS